MEAELIKENFLTSYPSANLALNILVEGETIVPDSKDDIAEIILVEGRSYLERTEVQNGRIIFTGCTEFTVLYTPENTSAVSFLNAKIPFNHIEEYNGISADDKFSVHPTTIHSECALLNSRKISLKATVSVDFTSYSDIEIPIATDIRSSDAELMKETISVSHISACSEETFNISEFLEHPSSSPPIETLLLSRPSISECSVKVVTGKAVAKGTLSVFQLYLTPDGNVSHIQHDIPFTEIIDVPSLEDEFLCDIDFYIKDYSLSEDFSKPETQVFTLSADISLTVMAFSTIKARAITDAYVPGYETKLSDATYKKFLLLSRENTTITLKESPSLPKDMPPMEQICPLDAQVTKLDSKAEDGKITVNGTVDVSVIYLSSTDKSINCYHHKINFTENFDCITDNSDVHVKATVSHVDFNFVNHSKLDLRCLVDLSASVSINTDSFPCIDSMEVGESTSKKRPSIIIYFVKAGDTLWNIAKRYSTTTEKIIMANALEKSDILNVGMRLLIPA